MPVWASVRRCQLVIIGRSVDFGPDDVERKSQDVGDGRDSRKGGSCDPPGLDLSKSFGGEAGAHRRANERSISPSSAE